MVAHNEELGTAMFTSYSNVSDAYVAGTANGASISANAKGIDLSNLSNNKFFGTVIKSGENDVPENTSSYQDQDFIGFKGANSTIINYLAIMNNGENNNLGITISAGQILKGVIIAANGQLDSSTNSVIAGGNVLICSGSHSAIIKPGDGKNGRSSRFSVYSSGEKYYSKKYTNDNVDMGSVKQLNNENNYTNGVIEAQNGIDGKEASNDTAQTRQRTFNIYTYSNYNGGRDKNFGTVSIKYTRAYFPVARTYTVGGSFWHNGVWLSPQTSGLYAVLGQYADEREHGIGPFDTTIFEGEPRGNIDEFEQLFKYLFLSMSGGQIYENPNGETVTVTTASST